MNVLRWFTELGSPSKGEEKNSLLNLILTDVMENDGEAYYNLRDTENWCVVICSSAHKEGLRAEMLNKSKLGVFKFYDKFKNKDTTISNVSVDDVASKCLAGGSHLCTFTLRFSKCWTEYHHFSKDAIADAFPDGYPIHVEDYNKFKPDFDRYGFTFTYKNAQLIIHHPWESKNESFQVLQGFLSE